LSAYASQPRFLYASEAAVSASTTATVSSVNHGV
jgi:hypothetical protein